MTVAGESTGRAALPGPAALDSEDQAEVRALVRSILDREITDDRVRKLDEAEEFDHDLYSRLGETGLVSLGVGTEDTEHPDVRHQVAVIEELASGPTSMAVCFVVQYMGVQLLTAYGTPQQREQVLAPLLEGSARVSFALTEPDGGTDVARAMRTRAERDADGWVLNGTKTWISGPKVADHAIVVARTGPPEPTSIDGITMFLVPLGADGVHARALDTIGIHSLDTCEVTFEDVRLPAESVLGEAGSGFRQVLGTLNQERMNAAAAALGIARGAFESALDYAHQRSAFGKPIGGFQTLQHRLVDSGVRIESARGLLSNAAAAVVDGRRGDVLSAMAKVAASEAATEVTDNGMRLLGGAGFSREFAMQRYFRDARLYTFAPLTDEMMHNYLGQQMLGLPRSY